MTYSEKYDGGSPPSKRGFIALLATMVCGALNDNLLRGALLMGVVSGGLWADALGAGGTGWVTTMLYLPFILLLGFSGPLADTYPKRTIIIVTRIVEVVLTLLLTWALWHQSLIWVCVIFFLLAAQSAYFSPAKYGSVPELVRETNLSRANGLLSLLTNLAIIVGVGVGGALLQVAPAVLGMVMVGISIVGLVTSLMITRQPARPRPNVVTKGTIKAHWQVLVCMRGTALIPTTIAWCWFYAVGSLLLAIIPWFNEPLQLTGSGLLAAPGIGIGLGGLVAGLASGDFIRSGLVPAGAIGMAISLVLLGLLPLSLITTIVLLVTTGVFAGCYLVPVLAMLQHIPEADFRARAVGTANFMTYVAMSVSAILFAVAASFFGAHVTIWFLVCGGMMTIVAGWSWRHRKELAMGASSSSFSSVAGPSK